MAAGDFTAFGIVEGNALKELISNMEISGGGSKNEYGKNVGGRIGYNIPLEDGSFNAGVSGYGYKSGGQKDAAISGIDARYTSGQNSFGVNYSPISKDININYTRNF